MTSSKFQDLTGQRFGKLIAIERTMDHIYPNGKHKVKWLCKCDCGNIKSILARNLTSGRTRSCGCIAKNRLKKDLVGQKFGKLAVVKRVKNSKKGEIQWLCKCDCGNEKIVANSHLINGNTKSCGCLKTEQIKRMHKKHKKFRFLIQLGGLSISLKNPFYKKSSKPCIKANEEGIIEI